MATTTAAIQTPTKLKPSSSARDEGNNDILSMTVSTWEEMNPRKRCTMEDCHVVHAPGTWGAPDPGMAYLGVYDGHGGRDMVEYLEYFLAYHVAEELKHGDDAPVAERLERAFVLADIHATQCGVETSGSTVVVCLVKKIPGTNQILIHTANAGDARAVLGHRGKATRLSHDHRPEDPAEVERINRAGGFLFKNRVLGVLAVTRSLGDLCFKRWVVAKPNYNETTIDMAGPSKHPTVLIVACDGLWDVFEDQEAVEFASKFAGDRSNVARFLVEEAIRRGSGDNVTVVVAWL